MNSPKLTLAALALAMLVPLAARATVSVGQPAFDFTKNELVSSAVGPSWSLSAHHGQVVILFVLGYF